MKLEFVGLYDLKIGSIWVRGKNLVPTIGRTALASRLILDTYSWPTHIAFGTGSNAPALTQTALQSEQHAVDLSSVGVKGSRISADSKIFEIFLETTAPVAYAGAGFTCREIGIFGRQGGKTAVMYSRFLIPDTAFVNGETWQGSWVLPFEERV